MIFYDSATLLMSEEQVMEPALTKASSLKEMEVPKDL